MKSVELFDVLDREGNPIGQQKSRQQILEDGDARNVVHIWLVNAPEQLVVQQRAEKGQGLWDNLWDVTVGGGNTSGEEPKRSAAREGWEEVGLSEEEIYSELQIIPGPKSENRWDTSKPMPDIGQMAYEFSSTFLLRKDVPVTSLVRQPEEVAALNVISFDALAAAITDDEEYKKWVPHPREYYLGVIAAIRSMQIS